jgi:hypothetical protein
MGLIIMFSNFGGINETHLLVLTSKVLAYLSTQVGGDVTAER